MTIEDLKNRFLWTSEKINSWTIMKNKEGPLRGDCDDFAVTALWIAEGESMLKFWWALLTFKGVIWRVYGKTGTVSHAVLWHRRYGWIDNQNPTWNSTKHHKLSRPRLFPEALVLMFLGMFRK